MSENTSSSPVVPVDGVATSLENVQNNTENVQVVVPEASSTIPSSEVVVNNSGNDDKKRKDPPSESHNDKKKRKDNYHNKKKGTASAKRDNDWGSREPKERKEGEEKFQKRRVAIFIGYLGTNYNGSQTSNFTNPNVKTVEETFFKALCQAGGVSEDNSTDMNKVHFHRSSRTDKGVHAASNVLEMKLLMKPGLEEEVRKLLPDDLVFYGYKKVSKAFNAKEHCTARTYEYLLPTCALSPDPKAAEWFGQINIDKITKQDVENENLLDIYNYEPTPEQIEKANRVLQNFVGTNSFHNYTQLTKAKPNSFNRHITKFECSQPFEIDGMKVVRLTVTGSSFIYNQIRKMVGFMIAVMRGSLNETDFSTSVDKEVTANVPLAPANGLLLCEQEFKRYNSKQGAKVNGHVTPSVYYKEMEDFKKRIYSHMLKIEREESIIGRFLLHSRGWRLIKASKSEAAAQDASEEPVLESLEEDE